MKLAAHERAVEADKEALLTEKYSTFRDKSESFPPDRRTLIVPTNMDRLDRITVILQMQDILARENTALHSARIYRDRCSQLKQRIRELKEEK